MRCARMQVVAAISSALHRAYLPVLFWQLKLARDTWRIRDNGIWSDSIVRNSKVRCISERPYPVG